ncbi:MAG: hypothetical protein IAE96_04805 [Chitinophagaceae bacterium]|nr:hypothetical protein [Chitinophagaceae bacterium]
MADIKEVQKQLDAALAANKDLAEKNAALQSSNDLLAEEKDVLMKSLDEVTADRDALKSEVARLITTPDEKETESGVGGIFEVGGSKYQVLVPSYNIPGFGIMTANDLLANTGAQAVLVKSGSGLIKSVK